MPGPPLLQVQMVRFFYKTDVQQKAKILRRVQYGMELDLLEWCAPDLKAQLEAPRAAHKAAQDALAAEKKTKKLKPNVRAPQLLRCCWRRWCCVSHDAVLPLHLHAGHCPEALPAVAFALHESLMYH